MSRSTETTTAPTPQTAPIDPRDAGLRTTPEQPEEIGGRGGLDPTRYGDWEKNGRCIDF